MAGTINLDLKNAFNVIWSHINISTSVEMFGIVGSSHIGLFNFQIFYCDKKLLCNDTSLQYTLWVLARKSCILLLLLALFTFHKLSIIGALHKDTHVFS